MGTGGLAIDIKDFFEITEGRKRLFCLNVSTLLSLIVGQKAIKTVRQDLGQI